MILRAIFNMFSKEQRDAGTKQALGTILASPFVTEILMSDPVQDAAHGLGSQVVAGALDPKVLPYLGGLAILLGVVRASQPAAPAE